MQKRTEMFENILKVDRFHNLIAIDGDNPCGLCSYGKSRDNDPSDYGEIIAIHTKPEYWGKDVGKALMDTALSELRRLGYSKIMLWTFEANPRARRFYEKYGFVSDGMIKDSGFANAKEIRYRLEPNV
ncbi:MAG: GNAT family N-acetyltransferase [Eubacteriales bacterium]|nr:GNAT family N-acetyltransferase [Eubacteriales bacterium]